MAVDTPSGLDGDSGQVLGVCVKASATVTFGAAKRGMLLGDAREYTGRIIVQEDVGLIPYPFK